MGFRNPDPVLAPEIICLPLHEHSNLLEDTINLLNAEWPRGKNARLRSLQQCSKNDEFPVSLILVQNSKNKQIVIAHSRILAVPYKPEACFVESVVVDKKLRGKGYGKLIMERTEEYVIKKGVKTIYLTTHDKQDFYQKLGYDFCDPVVICEGASAAILQKMECLKLESNPAETVIPCKDKFQNSNEATIIRDKKSKSVVPPPPPPLPIQIIGSQFIKSNVKMHMKKVVVGQNNYC